ncbi:MAG: DNA ligase D [Polaromonas sp.]|nr:DNA ligase D [Polaromonas sp.]
MTPHDTLETYRKKRNFGLTPEPATGGEANAHAPVFVIQKHWASHLHYDFRLEFEGTLKSWAVPKGPSLDPHDKRMAVQVEDHPLSYGDFEGDIPARQYGAGKVIVWDSGTWTPTEDPAKGFAEGRLKFELHGHKLQGRWTLIRMKGKSEKQVPWLLIKERDKYVRPASDYDITQALPDSVKSLQSKKVQRTGHAFKRQRGAAATGLPPASVKAALPALLQPQLATLAESPPPGGDWIYELKFDGYRLMTRIDGDHVRCFTRNGHDWTAKMPALVAAIKTLKLKSGWLDGEIIVPDASGIPDFGLLQNAFESKGSRSTSMVYYLFDLPFYTGYDLRGVALVERRALLKQLMDGSESAQLRFSDSFEAMPKDLIASACKLGFEGLIAKRADAGYQSGRSTDWLKLKCGKRQEFLICGYTDPKGSRAGLGSLLLGLHDDQGELKYAGNVGSGFTDMLLAGLSAQLNRLKTDKSAFKKEAVSGAAISGQPHWVKPQLLAEVSFAGWTAGGRIRHAVFRGLRHDKSPKTITRETAVHAAELKSATRIIVEQPALPTSLRITHPERIIDKKSGTTKLDVVQHYARVQSLILPHLKGRPVSLVRAPDGVSGELFFQKHAKAGEMPGVKMLETALDPGHDSLLEISTAAGLLSAAQMNTLEFHTWNANASSISRPDRMTFDLDPGDNLPWPKMQEAATLVRTLLEELELVSFLKTSGGKGLHVVVPLKRLHDWATVKDFSHAIVKHLANTIPQRFVAKSGPKNRVGKIFVDYLRNGFGATTVSAWSARARPGMGVSVPVKWEELPDLTCGAHWNLHNLGSRLATGNQPWADYAASAQSLGKAMKIMKVSKTS